MSNVSTTLPPFIASNGLSVQFTESGNPWIDSTQPEWNYAKAIQAMSEYKSNLGLKMSTKSKRGREVYPTDMIAHLWAHQTQRTARNHGNFSFDGRRLYSYTTVIALLVQPNKRDGKPDDKAAPVALISENRWSITTGGHLSNARLATSHLKTFTVHSLYGSRAYDTLDMSTHPENVAYYVQSANEAFDKSSRARTNREYHYKRGLELLATARDYCETFKLAASVRRTIPADPADAATFMAELKAANAKRAAEAAKAKAKAVAFVRANVVPAWLKGSTSLVMTRDVRPIDVPRYHTINDGVGVGVDDGKTVNVNRAMSLLDGAYIRVRRTNNEAECETTLGARFPLAHAVRALAFVRALNGRAYARNGHTVHVGHFKIDSVDANGTVRAGCHTVHREALDALYASFDADSRTTCDRYAERFSASLDNAIKPDVDNADALAVA